MPERAMKQDVETLRTYAKVGIDDVLLEERLASSNEISPKSSRRLFYHFSVDGYS